jgi:hypothetical protein
MHYDMWYMIAYVLPSNYKYESHLVHVNNYT